MSVADTPWANVPPTDQVRHQARPHLSVTQLNTAAVVLDIVLPSISINDVDLPDGTCIVVQTLQAKHG